VSSSPAARGVLATENDDPEVHFTVLVVEEA
jgi:hypothetical protein